MVCPVVAMQEEIAVLPGIIDVPQEGSCGPIAPPVGMPLVALNPLFAIIDWLTPGHRLLRHRLTRYHGLVRWRHEISLALKAQAK